MKKFLSIMLSVLVIVTCVFGFVACDEQDEPNESVTCEHVYGEWTIDTAATCTTNGAKQKTCTKCGDVVEAVITSTGHVFDQEVVDAKYLVSEATCTDKAKYYKSCACGEKGTETFEIGDVLEHDYGEWIVDTAATLNAAGAKHKICSICYKRVDETIPQLTIAGKSYYFDNAYVEYSTAIEGDFESAKISEEFVGTDEDFINYLAAEYCCDALMMSSSFIFNDNTSVVTQKATMGGGMMSLDFDCSVTGDYAISALAMIFKVVTDEQIELMYLSFGDDKINIIYVFTLAEL